MSLPTLTFRTVTYCTDPRCVTSRRCWREENEDFGNAPGDNYGPRCVPVPAFGLARGAELVYALGVEEGERRAAERIVALLNAEAERADCGHIEALADHIERGEHRREEER